MDELIQSLTDLGLTALQARILLTLHKFDCASVKDVSKDAEIHRQEIYTVLIELQRLGLVERKIGLPNLYKAIPLGKTLEILLERKKCWMSEVQQTTAELIQKVNNESKLKANTTPADYDFTLVTGVERFSQALNDWIRNAQTIDEVIKFDSFSHQIGERLKVSTFVYREDVKVRLVTCTSPENVNLIGLKRKNLEIRFVPFETPVDIAVYNGNRGHLAIFSNRDNVFQTEVAALTSNNPCYVKMLQNYFDLLWNIGKVEKKKTKERKSRRNNNALQLPA